MRLTYGLVALLGVHALVIPLVLSLSGTPRANTVCGHFERFLNRNQRADSWEPMAAAQDYASEQPGRDIYDEIFFRRGVKFQYAPTALLYVRRLSLATLNLLSWTAVWITVALTVAAFRHALRATSRPPTGVPLGVASLAAAGLAVTFYPLIKGYTLGQIQVWIDALFALAVWTWLRGSTLIAGVALGLACLIKPQLTPVVIWAVARRQWKTAGAAVAVCAVGLAVSIATYGPSSHAGYLRVLTYIGARGEVYYPNQSFNGFLNRLMANGDSLTFDNHSFSPPHSIVSAGTNAAAVVLLTLALVLPARTAARGGPFDFAIITLTATMVSPIAWEHHYGLLLPLFAILVPPSLNAAPAGRWTALLLAIAFVLTGQYLAPAQRLAGTPWNVFQSYVLGGGLLLLGVAYAAVLRTPAAQPDPQKAA